MAAQGRLGYRLSRRFIPIEQYPQRAEAAQLALAVEAYTHDLQPTQLPSDSGPVVKERVEGALVSLFMTIREGR